MEERLEEDGISGMFDLYGEEDGVRTLFDYKVSGSYKVAKAIGLKGNRRGGPREVFRSGPRKGKPRTVKRIVQGEPDLGDWGLQLNHYRQLLVEGIPRGPDGPPGDRPGRGTYLAKKRGLTRNIYLIDVPRLEDDAVTAYFAGKRDALKAALETNAIPPPCSEDERWQDRKCAEFCLVADSCDHGQAIRASQAIEEVA